MRPDEPERPTQDEGDLFLYTEDDLAQLAAEVYAWVREVDGVDEATAEAIADAVFELHTGQWLTDVHE